VELSHAVNICVYITLVTRHLDILRTNRDWQHVQACRYRERSIGSAAASAKQCCLCFDLLKCTAPTRAGTHLEFPVLVAPMAMQQMAHPQGELAVARACRACGAAMIVSTMANYPLEAVAAAAGAGHLWFQLYVFRCAPHEPAARADLAFTMALAPTSLAAAALDERSVPSQLRARRPAV
jgi:FMN-dependent dehydrogenase